MKKLNITLFFFIAVVTSMMAQTTFQVIPPRNVIAGNTFYVTYRLTNGDGNSIQAPAIAGCKLLRPQPGVSTMQSVQIINGHQTSSTTEDYTYTYRAEKEGSYTIPSASIVVDGKTYRTQPADFKVLPPDKNAQSNSQQGGYQAPTIDRPSSQDSAPIGKEDMFVRVILNKNHAYEGEAIECTLKLYTKFERIQSFMVTSPPTFNGFLIEDLDTQASLNAVEHYNGQNYITAVLKRCIIYPQKSGKLTINPGSYDLTVVQLERVSNGFFISARPIERDVTLSPSPQSVEIAALPSPAPASFNGAVGRFNFDSQISATEVRTGEAVSLRYIITGTGNIKFINAPKPVIPDEFEQYTPKLEENTRVSGTNMTGTVTAEYTIVPQSVGDFKIPAQEFSYFDVDKKQYVTVTADGYTLRVAKGSGVTTSVDQRDIELKNTDILHIKLGNKDLSSSHKPIVRFWWYWSIWGIMLAMAICAVWMRNRQTKRNADVVGMRTSRANKVARKRLKAAEQSMKAHNSERFYDDLLKALWGYLGDKLGMPSSQLSRTNIVEALTSRGVSQEIADNTIKIIDECEMARYTPDSSLDSSVETLYREATDNINSLEKYRLKG